LLPVCNFAMDESPFPFWRLLKLFLWRQTG
jgi:hypothetical protein